MSDFNQEATELANKINRVKAKVDWWHQMNPLFLYENKGLGEDFQSLINDINALDNNVPKLIEQGYKLDTATELDENKLILFKSEIKRNDKKLNTFKKSFKAFMNKARLDFEFDD